MQGDVLNLLKTFTIEYVVATGKDPNTLPPLRLLNLFFRYYEAGTGCDDFPPHVDGALYTVVMTLPSLRYQKGKLRVFVSLLLTLTLV